MLSDESSSDSETGRFKCRSKQEDEKDTKQKEDSVRSSGRSRYSENSRFHREIERKRDVRDRFQGNSRDKNKLSRYSPVRRRLSQDRSLRRSHERQRYTRDSINTSKIREHRSSSKDRKRRSDSKLSKSSEKKRDFKEEIRHTITTKERSPQRIRQSKEIVSLSPEDKSKRSEVHKPPPTVQKRKSSSPIIVEQDSEEEEVRPGSYYSMIPAIVKDKSEDSSEIDSSDDEKLRAKLLNLEKKLHKSKKKKHKKKKKKRISREENDVTTTVEVTSTTDIQDKADNSHNNSDAVPEVTSTQKPTQQESCEEGEISSDDDQMDIDPNDLRYKLLKRSKKSDHSNKVDVCGPALPPHLQKKFEKSTSPKIEGPILPPHLQTKNIGPTIPDDMRKVLADDDREVIRYVSSEDEGIGPVPVGSEEKWSDAHRQLEERALDIKIKKLDGHSAQTKDVKSREEWMLELPEAKAKYIGLEARSFRAKEGPDMSDRSSWTDTPEEKARKVAGITKAESDEVTLKREARAKHIEMRDREQEAAVKKHKKKHKREESLLELHEKKLKKKKKKDEKEDGKKERRPFSRDVDLQVNRFDEAQKKSIVKKAQELDNRFSRGEAKYL